MRRLLRSSTLWLMSIFAISLAVSNSIAQTAAVDFDRYVIVKPTAAPGQSATLLSDGRWLFTGGRDGVAVLNTIFTRDFRAPDKRVQIPEISTRLTYARSGHSATVLPNGSVLIFGGTGATGALVAAAEVFNPATNELTVINDTQLSPRTNHTATLMTDGRILIVGGRTTSGATLKQAEFFDPDALLKDGQPIDTRTARSGQQAALLPTGQGLIWSGNDAANIPLRNGELYDPVSKLFSLVSPTDASLPSALYLDAPPTVQATIPQHNDTNVSVEARIAVRFSKQLAVGSITEQTAVLVGPAGAVSGHVVAAEFGLLAFVTPRAHLLPDTTYTLFLSGLADAQDQLLPMTTISFRTESILADPQAGNVGNNASSSSTNQPSADEASDSNSIQETAPRTSRDDQRRHSKDPKKRDKEEEDGSEYEDWTPRDAHRHGRWRVLGGQDEPRVKGVLTVPQALTAPTGETALSGRIARLNGRPIEGVTVSIGDTTTKTDKQGRFLLSKLASGSHELTVNGSTATSGGRRYATHYIQVDVAATQTTVIKDAIYIARMNPANEFSIPSPTTTEVVLTHPKIPGLELHIPKGAVIRSRDGKIVSRLSITPLPVDRVPFAVPEGFPVYFTVQPAGAFVDNTGTGGTEGIRVVYPNYLKAAAGTRVQFWNYDPSGQGWQVYGGGTVTNDGSQVVPDSGVTQRNLMAFGWGLENTQDAPPDGPPPGGCTQGGDPVDCATGLFLHHATDFYIPDTMPISLTRTYRQKDTKSRDFGIGANHSYGMFLSNPESSTSTPSKVDVILPDGGKLRFNRTAGTTVNDIVFKHNATPTRYQGAKLQISTITHAWEMTLKDKSVYIFQPHAPNLLIGIRDRYGNTLTITRSGNNISQILSPHGRYLNFIYDTANRITQATDNLGRSVVYEYDTEGRLWKVTDPDGKVEQYGYDSQHRMTTVTDKRGNVMVTNVYDANGRVQQQTLADGTIWQFAYVLDGNGKVTQSDATDPRGYVRRVTFNSDGYLIQEIRALGQPEQRTTVFVREPVTNLLTSVTDFLGRVTQFTYDPMGNNTSVTRLFGTANAVTESFVYDSVFSELTRYTDELNHATQLGRDSMGNLVSVTDPLGHSETAAYDAEGNMVAVTNALGKTSQLAYDLGDLASATDPLSRTFSMFTDRAGRTVGITDPLGNNTRYLYDAVDRIHQMIDAQDGITRMAYDGNGNTLTVRDPRNLASHAYTYDSRNRVKTYTDPLGNGETYNYDGLGNRTSKIDRKNQTTSYAYDAHNRLRTLTYPGGSTLTLTWDDANRTVTFVDSANGTITRQYDDLGRLTRETTPQGQIDYTYYTNGYRQSMTVLGKPVINYVYDAADRLTQISQGSNVIGMSYDAANRRTGVTLPNGIAGTFAFSDADELLSIAYDKGAVRVADAAYAYDANGQRISASGSLIRPTLDNSLSGTSYDAGNHLSALSASPLTYDSNGNLTAISGSDGNTFVWNSRNQLISTGKGSTFSYDALGRLVSKTVNGTATAYQYDGFNQVVAGGNTMLRSAELDELFTQVTASGTINYLTDVLGSASMLTDASGNVTTSYSYGAYGATTTGAATVDTSFKYAGADYDAADNLYYLRERYYSPQLQRFVSEDPIGLNAGVNVNAYVFGRPIDYSDPMGLGPKGAALGGAIGGFVGGVGGAILGGAGGAAGGTLAAPGVGTVGGGIAGGIQGAAAGAVAGGAIGAAVGSIVEDIAGMISDPSSPNWKPWGPFPNPDAPGDDTWAKDPNGSGNSDRAKSCRKLCSRTSLPGEALFRDCLKKCMKNPPATCP